MSKAKAPRADRFLRPLIGTLERYMLRAGLIAFMADPAAAPAAADPAAPPAAAPAADPTAPAAAAPAADPAKPADPPAADPKDTKAADPAAKDPKASAGAPEAYTDFTLPEGVTPDAKLIDGFKTVAKELNLPQDGAQKVVSLFAEHQAAQFGETVKAWGEQAKADKEIGGDKFAENLAVSKKALEQFATPEFRTFLEKTGLGNHPEMIRAFYKAGRAISEDGFVAGHQGGKAQTSIAQRMYPNMNP